MTNIQSLESYRKKIAEKKALEEYHEKVKWLTLTPEVTNEIYQALAESNFMRAKIFGTAVKSACLCCNEKQNLTYTPEIRWYKCEKCNGYVSAELVPKSIRKKINVI